MNQKQCFILTQWQFRVYICCVLFVVFFGYGLIYMEKRDFGFIFFGEKRFWFYFYEEKILNPIYFENKIYVGPTALKI